MHLFRTNVAGRKFGIWRGLGSPSGGAVTALAVTERALSAPYGGTSPKGRGKRGRLINSNLSFCFCTLRSKNQRARVGTLVFCEELGNGLPQVTKITFAMTYMDDTGRKEPGMQRMERLSPVLPLVRAHPGIRVSQ